MLGAGLPRYSGYVVFPGALVILCGLLFFPLVTSVSPSLSSEGGSVEIKVEAGGRSRTSSGSREERVVTEVEGADKGEQEEEPSSVVGRSLGGACN